MADSAAGESQQRTIPINQLSIQDLGGLQQQLDKESTFFAESLSQLREVQSKFRNSAEAVSGLDPKAKDQEALVPLSESMYVAGTLNRVESVIVDIGTGYYAEMSLEKAKDYFDRKCEFLQKQIDSLQAIVTEKQRSKAIITDALQTKIQSQLASQPQKSAA